MEVSLQILGIKSYNEDVLLLVIPTTTYSETVLVVVESKIIDRAMSIITKGEVMKATMTCRQGDKCERIHDQSTISTMSYK